MRTLLANVICVGLIATPSAARDAARASSPSAPHAAPSTGPGVGHVDVQRFARCDGIRDDREALVRAVAAARGRTLWIPSGCRLLLSSPGPDRAVVTLDSGTRIHCEDPSAGFTLATRACRGGRYPDAACGSDADCPGALPGGCAPSVPQGAFAAERERIYTIFKAAPGASGLAITGCSFEMSGIDRYGRCVGGGSDGKPCYQVCAEGTTYAGFRCGADGDCGEGSPAGACRGREDCTGTDPAGACTGEPGSPVGPGKINPIDLGGAASSEVARNRLSNQRRGQVAINAGVGARLDDNTLAVTVPTATTVAAGNAVKPVAPPLDVESGIVLEGRGMARGNIVTASGRLIAALGGFNLVAGNHLEARARGSVGVLVGGQQNRIEGNQVTAYSCIRGEPQGADNVSLRGNRCLGGAGEKIRVTGSGWQVEGNYLAWGGGDSKAQVLLGQPGSPGHPVQHLVLVGNIVHSDQPLVALIRFASAGAQHNQVVIVGNSLLASGESAVGIDAAVTEATDQPFIEDLVIQGNLLSGLKVGVRLPAKPGVVRGAVVGTNRFSRVSVDIEGNVEPAAAP